MCFEYLILFRNIWCFISLCLKKKNEVSIVKYHVKENFNLSLDYRTAGLPQHRIEMLHCHVGVFLPIMNVIRINAIINLIIGSPASLLRPCRRFKNNVNP